MSANQLPPPPSHLPPKPESRQQFDPYQGYDTEPEQPLIRIGSDSTATKSEDAEDDRPLTKIYIGNLPNHATLFDLEDCFGQIGKCMCTIKNGFGFVEFLDPAAAAEAVEKYNEGHFLGVQIKVELSRGRRLLVKNSNNSNSSVSLINSAANSAANSGPTKSSGPKASVQGSSGSLINPENPNAPYATTNNPCHRCGSFTHWARECPEKRNNDRSRAQEQNRNARMMDSQFQPMPTPGPDSRFQNSVQRYQSSNFAERASPNDSYQEYNDRYGRRYYGQHMGDRDPNVYGRDPYYGNPLQETQHPGNQEYYRYESRSYYGPPSGYYNGIPPFGSMGGRREMPYPVTRRRSLSPRRHDNDPNRREWVDPPPPLQQPYRYYDGYQPPGMDNYQQGH